MPQSATALAATAASAPAPLVVYPVPATGQVHLLVTPGKTGPVALDIYDGQGRLLRHLAAAGVQSQPAGYLLDSSAWATGVYTVRLSAAGQVTHSKLVLTLSDSPTQTARR